MQIKIVRTYKESNDQHVLMSSMGLLRICGEDKTTPDGGRAYCAAVNTYNFMKMRRLRF